MSKSILLRAVMLASVPTLVLAGAPIQSAGPSGVDAFVTINDPLAASTPTTPLSDGGANVFGVGGGRSDLGFQQFSLSAHAGKRGDYGQWSVKVTSPTGMLIVRYSVDVDCVHIHGGNRGVIKGFVDTVEPTNNSLGIAPGQRIILGIKDAGDPAAGQPDDFFTPHTDFMPLLSCKDLFYLGNFNNVDQGNVLVKME